MVTFVATFQRLVDKGIAPEKIREARKAFEP